MPATHVPTTASAESRAPPVIVGHEETFPTATAPSEMARFMHSTVMAWLVRYLRVSCVCVCMYVCIAFVNILVCRHDRHVQMPSEISSVGMHIHAYIHKQALTIAGSAEAPRATVWWRAHRHLLSMNQRHHVTQSPSKKRRHPSIATRHHSKHLPLCVPVKLRSDGDRSAWARRLSAFYKGQLPFAAARASQLRHINVDAYVWMYVCMHICPLIEIYRRLCMYICMPTQSMIRI